MQLKLFEENFSKRNLRKNLIMPRISFAKQTFIHVKAYLTEVTTLSFVNFHEKVKQSKIW